MNAGRWVAAVAVTIFVIFLLVIAGWLAGAAGVLLGALVIVALGLRMAGFFGILPPLPAWALRLTGWTMTVGLLSIGAIALTTMALSQFGSWGSGTSASAPGARQVYDVGERDDVVVTPPPRSWSNICTDKSVLVRVDDGNFRLDPPCKVFARQSDGSFTPAETMGDATSGIYHVKAMPGAKMAQVTVSSVPKK